MELVAQVDGDRARVHVRADDVEAPPLGGPDERELREAAAHDDQPDHCAGSLASAGAVGCGAGVEGARRLRDGPPREGTSEVR